MLTDKIVAVAQGMINSLLIAIAVVAVNMLIAVPDVLRTNALVHVNVNLTLKPIFVMKLTKRHNEVRNMKPYGNTRTENRPCPCCNPGTMHKHTGHIVPIKVRRRSKKRARFQARVRNFEDLDLNTKEAA